MWRPVLYTSLPHVLLYDLQSTFTLNLICSSKLLFGISHCPTFTEIAMDRDLENHPRIPASHGSAGTDPNHWLQSPPLFPKTQLPTAMCNICLYLFSEHSVHIRAIKTSCITLSSPLHCWWLESDVPLDTCSVFPPHFRPFWEKTIIRKFPHTVAIL